MKVHLPLRANDINIFIPHQFYLPLFWIIYFSIFICEHFFNLNNLLYASDRVFSQDLGRHAELLSQLLYNHGLVLLSIQQPTLAHSCWHLSALFQQHTTNRPRFWIRLAECCITHHLLLVRHTEYRDINYWHDITGKRKRRTTDKRTS